MRTGGLVTLFCVLAIALASSPPELNNQEKCVEMTPNRKQLIAYIEEEFSKLLLKLEHQSQDLVITDVTVSIQKYTEEYATKDINLNITVNDCANTKSDDDEDVVYFEEAKDVPNNEENNDSDANADANEVIGVVDESESDSGDNQEEYEDDQSNASVQEVATEGGVSKEKSEETTIEKPPKAKAIIYRLSDEEYKIVSEMERKRGVKPFFLIQHASGKNEIKFIN